MKILQLDLTLHSEAVACTLSVGAENENGNSRRCALKPRDVEGVDWICSLQSRPLPQRNLSYKIVS
jgi:hypothetical protein